MQYRAPVWLPGGQAQTIWPALWSRRVFGPRPEYRRERWDAPDGDFVDVDWRVDIAPTLSTACGSLDVPLPESAALRAVHARADGPGAAALSPSGAELARDGLSLRSAPTLPTKARPLLVQFHGLEGSSRSHYSEAFADCARERGWAYAVPHFRGCSGEMNRAPRAYHSGDFEEIGWILNRFRAWQDAHGRGPILAVGISLGGNALMRWAEEMGATAGRVVSAVASVCSPLDLAAGGWAIGRGFNRLVYTRMFLNSMKPKALAKLAQHPGLFQRDVLLAARNLHEFDNVFTAPLHGFRNTEDYWQRASAKPHLDQIRLPALAVNARNDPFVPAASLPRPGEVGAHVTLWQPAHGGHVGFAKGRPPGHVRSMPDAVSGWLAEHLPSSAVALTHGGRAHG